MNILFLSTTFPDAASPSRGTYNAALCRSLARNHQLRVISPRMFTEVHRPRRPVTAYRTPEVFRNLAVQVEYPTYWYTPRILQQCYGGQMWWSIQSVVKRAIHEFQPDAILSYWAHPDGDVGLRAARQAGIPAAVIVGGSDVLLLPRERQRGERIRDVLIQSDAVIAVSEGLRQAAIDLKVSAGRVHTVYQGIDPNLFHSRNRAECRRRLGLSDEVAHLVWVGRMAAVKGLDVLLAAAEKLKSRGRKFQLHLLGDGPQRPSVLAGIRSAGLEEQVRLAGAVPPQAVADWYRAADLAVLSSHSEGLPNVLREALACGTPFVSTDVGSIRELADSGCSALVPPCDPTAFADAVERMLQPEFRQQALRYQPRTWDDCADETALLLESLCRAEKQGRPKSLATAQPARSSLSPTFPAKLCCDMFPEELGFPVRAMIPREFSPSLQAFEDRL